MSLLIKFLVVYLLTMMIQDHAAKIIQMNHTDLGLLFLVHVDTNIANVNQELNVTTNPEIFNMYIWLDNAMLPNETIDISGHVECSYGLAAHICLLKGIVISKDASPIILLPEHLLSKNGRDISFLHSQLKFYTKQFEPIESSCDHFLASYFDLDVADIQNGHINKSGLFEQLIVSPFTFRTNALSFTQSVDYIDPLCPLLLKNAKINMMNIFGLHNSSLTKHKLKFRALNESFGQDAARLDLNCIVNQLNLFDIYRVDIDEELVNVDVFLKMRSLFILGVMGRIADSNLFKNFRDLISVSFHIVNLREFLHASDNKWLAGLN